MSSASERRDSLFVTSFCEEPDLLSQWRGYANGGFAIGFEGTRLAELESETGGLSLVRVEYGREQGRPRLRRVFEEIAALGPYTSAESERAARARLMPEMARVKDPSFAEEKEWRLLLAVREGAVVRFRAGAGGVVPYVEVELPRPSPVREVVIGPGGEPGVRRRGIEQLLAHRDYSNVVVRQSQAPLRW